MVPPEQGLRAGHPPRLQIDDRLIVEDELFAFDGVAERVLQFQVFEGFGIHLRGEEAEGIAAVLLAFVHGGVGVLEQGFGVFAVVGKDGDAEAAGNQHLGAVDDEGLGQALQHLARQQLRVMGVVKVGQDDREFVAAEPGHRIRFPHAGGQAPGGLLEQFVTGVVAQGVVDLFEAVQVEEQDGDLGSVPSAPGQGMGQAVHEQRAVGKLGQRIIVRLQAQLFLALPYGLIGGLGFLQRRTRRLGGRFRLLLCRQKRRLGGVSFHDPPQLRPIAVQKGVSFFPSVTKVVHEAPVQ